MIQTALKRIAIDNLSAGMVLGTDVIDQNGNILIPQYSVITQKHIFRIKLYQILSVVILESSVTKDLMSIDEPSNVQTDHPGLPNFKHFKANYEEHEAAITEQLLKISSGHPIDTELLLSSHHTLLSSIKTKRDLFSFLYYIKAKNDDHTYTHSLNVAMLCSVFGQWLKWPEDKIKELTLAGLLHDIGKLQIDNSILNKPGKLTEEEFAIVKRHSQLGYEMVKKQPDITDNIKYGILMHHERINGSGYPLGFKDEQIHDFAKLLAIADIYDAMTSNRTYHEKFSPFKVIQLFEQDSFGLLDVSFLFTILDNLAHNYLGKTVRLSSGDEAEIIFIHNQSPSRPIVQIGNQMIDLIQHPELSILEIL